MKLQLIKSPHMSSAISRVMNELGPDALIYRTRSSASGVEILAGLPGEGEEFDNIEQSLGMIESQNNFVKVSDHLDNKMKEIDLTVKMLNSKISSLSSTTARVNYRDSEVQGVDKLERLGFSKSTIHEIFYQHIKKLKSHDDVNAAIEKIAAKHIDVMSDDLFLEKRCIALVGPTGVGKTSTIVKMALRAIDQFGSSSVGIITTDEGDISVKNVLNFYCNVFGIDLEYVSSPEEMKVALKKMKNKKSILIDTHGISQRDDISLFNLKEILNSNKKEISVYLTLPAQQQEAVLADIVKNFQFDNICGCVITKLDEAIEYCSVISVVMKSKLAIAYVCDGQDNRLNIRVPRKQAILSLIFGKDLPEDRLESNRQYTFQHAISLIGMGYF